MYRPEDLQLDPNINSTFDLNSLIINGDGDLPGDYRHQFKAFAAKQVPLPSKTWLTPGVSFNARSGGPTSYWGSHTLYGADTVYILPRGTGERLPWQFSIDPSVRYGIGLTDSTSVEFGVDVFNVFNFQAASQVDERFTEEDVFPIVNGSAADIAGCRSGQGRCILRRTSDGAQIDPASVNPNFGNPIRYQQPLSVRFGARFNF